MRSVRGTVCSVNACLLFFRRSWKFKLYTRWIVGIQTCVH